MNHFLVVHCKKEQHDVYVGRPSPFGNPFSHLKSSAAKWRCETREESIVRFEEWLRAPEQAALLTAVKAQLKGKILGCWCAPKACHADVLARIANNEE